MQNACWQDLSGPERRAAPNGGARRRHALGYLAPALAATMLASLLFHVLAETVSLIRWTDPVGMMSALFGAVVALAMAMPVVARLAGRANLAWRRRNPPNPGSDASALPGR